MTSTPSTPAGDAAVTEHLDPGTISCDWHFEVRGFTVTPGDVAVHYAEGAAGCAEAATVALIFSCGHVMPLCEEHAAAMQHVIGEDDLILCTRRDAPEHQIPFPTRAAWGIL